MIFFSTANSKNQNEMKAFSKQVSDVVCIVYRALLTITILLVPWFLFILSLELLPLDLFLFQILGSCPVDVMPGALDPTNNSMPQQVGRDIANMQGFFFLCFVNMV
jgi:hypothetical protein